MRNFETSISKSEVSKSNSMKITSLSKITLLQRLLFLTMFYIINLSPILVTKWGFMLIIIFSNYQQCPLPSTWEFVKIWCCFVTTTTGCCGTCVLLKRRTHLLHPLEGAYSFRSCLFVTHVKDRRTLAVKGGLASVFLIWFGGKFTPPCFASLISALKAHIVVPIWKILKLPYSLCSSTLST